MWKSLSGRRVEDIVGEVRQLLGDEDRVLHIGTDSKQRSLVTDFVTVVAVLDPGRGGRVFYEHHRVQGARSLPQKLFRETELSLELAVRLSREVAQDILVHVDVNEDLRHRSSRYVKAVAGMVIGYGFRVLVKPEAWCATHVADYVVNEKHLRVA